MWHSLKIGAAMVAVVGLAMSGLAVASAVDEPSIVDDGGLGAELVLVEALTPLIEEGTLTQQQADAVVGELAPLLARARFQDRTQELVRQFGRLAAEMAEVLGITPDDLDEQLQAGMTLEEIAEANGFTGEQLVARVADHVAAHLAVRVTAGKLDQARADEIVATTQNTLSELIDVEHPFGTALKERRHRALRLVGLDAAADAMGLSIDEVRTQLEGGSSLAQIADARGVTEDALVEAILAPLVERLERAVERGRLTEKEVAGTLTKASERVADAIHKVAGP